MFIVHDEDSQSMIGPFEKHEDAISFVVKVEDVAKYNTSLLEVYYLTEPDEWIQDNMDAFIMASS